MVVVAQTDAGVGIALEGAAISVGIIRIGLVGVIIGWNPEIVIAHVAALLIGVGGVGILRWLRQHVGLSIRTASKQIEDADVGRGSWWL